MNIVACPNCQKRLKLTAEQLKRKLRCTACPTRFVVGGQMGTGADGALEYLAIEIFDDTVEEGFEIVEEKSAPPPPPPPPAVPKQSAVSKPLPSSSPWDYSSEGAAEATDLFPDEFGLIDDEPDPAPPRTAPAVPPARPPAAPARVVSAPKRTEPVQPAVPKAKALGPAPAAPVPVAKKPSTPAAREFELGDDDTQKIDIHLELRTPAAAPPPVRPAPVPPPAVPRPAARKPAPPAAPPPQTEFDEVDVIDDESATAAVRKSKDGVPIVEAATEEEIAAFEASQAAQRKQAPPRRR